DLPSFSVRWDHTDDAVDVDLIKGNQREIYSFRQQKKGYRGHKTQRVSGSPRIHAVDIAIPENGDVFKGKLTLSLGVAVAVSDTLTFSDHCTATVVPAQKSAQPE